MRLSFLGQVSVDRNVVGGRETVHHGGGVLHGAVTASRLGAESRVYTLCAPEDRTGFSALAEAGVAVTFLDSQQSTSIRNVYPSEDPDDRRSAVISRARPFEVDDLERVERCDLLEVNALWGGEVPAELLPLARRRATALAGDAQGFLRQVDGEGALVLRDWSAKVECLPLFDFFKADLSEARVLTGLDEPRAAARRLVELGARVVVITHGAGVCVADDRGVHEAPFGSYSLAGRTGRGDTCMAAFLVFQDSCDLGEATRRAAEVTTRKMQHPGPFRG